MAQQEGKKMEKGKAPKLRISFLAPKIGLSGGTRIFLGYAHHLALRGHEVRVYVKDKSFVRRLVGNSLRLGVPKWLGDFRAQVVRVPDFTKKSIPDADVIFVTTAQVAQEVALFPREKGCKYYLVQHDESLYHANQNLVEKAYTQPFKRIAVSSWVLESLRSKFNVDASLLLNPIDREQFKMIPGLRDVSEVRILLLEHPFEWKGTDEGYRIAQRIQARHPEVKIFGFGARTSLPKGSCRRYDSYTYDPPQNDMAELYSRADIYLCSSWDEGFGLPSLEAMLCGAAVATYDNGGSRDFAIHEQTALVAQRRNIDALEHELERLVADKPLRDRVALEGKRQAELFPTWVEQAGILESILLSDKEVFRVAHGRDNYSS